MSEVEDEMVMEMMIRVTRPMSCTTALEICSDLGRFQ